MRDVSRGCASGGECASVQGSRVAVTGRSRRRWSAEGKVRVDRDCVLGGYPNG